MTESKTPRHAFREEPVEEPSPPAEKAVKTPKRTPRSGCNLPGCDAAPEWRGLCPAHRQTHRGLADPKEGGDG